MQFRGKVLQPNYIQGFDGRVTRYAVVSDENGSKLAVQISMKTYERLAQNGNAHSASAEFRINRERLKGYLSKRESERLQTPIKVSGLKINLETIAETENA